MAERNTEIAAVVLKGFLLLFKGFIVHRGACKRLERNVPNQKLKSVTKKIENGSAVAQITVGDETGRFLLEST